MKKIILFNLLIFINIASLHSQHTLQKAPLNPDFRINIKSKSNNYGVIPPPAKCFFDSLNFKHVKNTNSFAIVYDMRNENRMTSVKNQTGNGCWDFASMGAVESQWKVLGSGTFDLGEHNLQQCHGFDPSRSTWGNHFMSSAYYLRRSGPISQDDDTVLTCPTLAKPTAYITDVRYLPNNQNIIKQALLDYGGIYTMIYWDDNKYNSTNKTYFYNGTPSVNHAVVIAGWNDTLTTAGGSGAWIVKNSWGSGWGDNGYFYISYNDSSILDYNAVWPSRIDYNPLTHVYNYDSLGYIEEWGYNDGNADYGLVRFVATRNHKITKVGSYVVGGNSTVKFQIYKNFNSNTLTLSNLLTETSEKTCEFPGYYNYDLDSAINVLKSDTFYIKVKYDVPGYGYPIPIEDTLWYYENNSWKHDYSNPSIETNKCWISSDGNNTSWYSIGAGNPNAFYAVDLCIKAYGENAPITWTGKTNTSWSENSNWDSGTVPTATDDVVIPYGCSNYPLTNSLNYAYTRKLVLEPGSKLTLPIACNLTVNDSLIIKSNDTLSASLIDFGTLSYTAGKTNFIRTLQKDEWSFITQPTNIAKALIFNSIYVRFFINDNNWGGYISDPNQDLIPMQSYAIWATNRQLIVFNGLLNTGQKKKLYHI